MNKIGIIISLLFGWLVICAGTPITQMHAAIAKKRTSSLSCPDDGSPDVANTTTGSFDHFGRLTSQYYVGQRWPATEVERRICKILITVDSGAGDTAAKTWVAQIWSMSGNNLSSVIANGTSATVTGTNPTVPTEVKFQWSTPPTLAANTAYAITVSLAASAAVDNGVYDYITRSTTDLILGSFAVWDEDLSMTLDRTTHDATIKIFYYD